MWTLSNEIAHTRGAAKSPRGMNWALLCLEGRPGQTVVSAHVEAYRLTYTGATEGGN